jgi:amino-acid N-acetyltransferase
MVTIRKAKIKDVDKIFKLISHYSKKGLLLPKSLFKIYKNVQTFFVLEEDKKVVACVSLIVLWKDLAEICSLVVDDPHKRKGFGKKLVYRCIEEANKLGIPQVIALTYQDKFFRKMGFKLVDKDIFPRKLMWECLECPRLEQCDERAYLRGVKKVNQNSSRSGL